MNNLKSATNYSPLTRLWMEINGKTIALAQTAGDWVIPESPRNLPPQDVVIVIEVDGRQHRRHVRLTEGMSDSSTFVPVSALPQPVQKTATI